MTLISAGPIRLHYVLEIVQEFDKHIHTHTRWQMQIEYEGKVTEDEKPITHIFVIRAGGPLGLGYLHEDERTLLFLYSAIKSSLNGTPGIRIKKVQT